MKITRQQLRQIIKEEATRRDVKRARYEDKQLSKMAKKLNQQMMFVKKAIDSVRLTIGALPDVDGREQVSPSEKLEDALELAEKEIVEYLREKQ